ncbi:MAG: DNA mismatch repair endonuclease MutL, partial [Bacteroidales bacterium]|nr:DNA mismatch repair endonuclease MutL [Bacteroidales bacterium]
MSLIQLLPEHVANQIAAGEVVNRPASAVKELLENAVDAGADDIHLLVRDAGKTLIQVIDNGCGMSAEDAEKCFLRHATSKIRQADDLYTLQTMGFRGEALASIAAVACVELKTKRPNDETGYTVCMEGEKRTSAQACACPDGTQISVKNIYFNTPARRQFLKSDEVEYRYIEEEFVRVAMAHPEIKWQLTRDEKQVYHLEAGSFRQRVVQLMGRAFEQRLVRVHEAAGDIDIDGFICTPEYTTKNRSKQYLFVNTRYVKHIGLSHAIETAYKQLVPEKNYPAYFLRLTVRPETIDVNIHPTKTEIRFNDEKLIYGVLLSVVKHAIGVTQLAPALDFDNENDVVVPTRKPLGFPEPPRLNLDPNYD